MTEPNFKIEQKNGQIDISTVGFRIPGPIINLNFGLIKFYAAVEQSALGPKKGVINLPGNIQGWYLNFDIEVFFQKILYGHYEIV